MITHFLCLSIYICICLLLHIYIKYYIYGLLIIDGIDIQINITQHCSEVKKAVAPSFPHCLFLQSQTRKTKIFFFSLPIDRNYEKKAINFCQYINNIDIKESLLDAIASRLKIKNGITKNKNLYILTKSYINQ